MIANLPPFTLSHTTKNYPKWPYEKIKNDILGSDYKLSLTFVGETRAQQLNENYRHKDYTPNVLSFPLTKDSGEIYLCLKVAYKEAKKYYLTPEGHVVFLFIHGCLHLKGYRHGATMERLEQLYRNRYHVI